MDASIIGNIQNPMVADGALVLAGFLFFYFIFAYFVSALDSAGRSRTKDTAIFAMLTAVLVCASNHLTVSKEGLLSGEYAYLYAIIAYIYAALLIYLGCRLVLLAQAALYKWVFFGLFMAACLTTTYNIQIAGYEKSATLNYDLALISLAMLMASLVFWGGLLVGLRIFLTAGKVTASAKLVAAMMFALSLLIVQQMSVYAFSSASSFYDGQEKHYLTNVQVVTVYLSVATLLIAALVYPRLIKIKARAGDKLENIYPDILMATGVMVAVALIIFSQWYNKKAHQAEVSLLHIEQQIDRRVTRAHLWLEELKSGSSNIEWEKDVVENLLMARKYVKASLTGEVVDEVFSYRATDPNLVDVFTSLDQDILSWQKLLLKQQERSQGWSNSFYLQLEDHIFFTVDYNLTVLNTITERTTKEEWRKVALVNKLTFLCLALLLFGIYRIYHKNKTKMHQAAVSLNAALHEIEVQKLALDEHAILSVADRKGKITYSNKKFTEISQYTAEELLGKDHRILNSHYHSREFFRDMWLTINRGKIWRGRLRNRRKDGSLYWVDTTIVPFLDDNGKPYQFISIRNDITLVKEAEDSLRNLNQELERRVAQRTAELAEINRAVEADREVLQLMVEGTSTATGKDFFSLLVRYLAAVLKVEYVIVAEQLYSMPLKSRTIAVRAKNAYEENFEYTLEGTPCEEVIINRCAIYARELNNAYAEIPLLRDVKIESYMGVPMSDSRGRILGHIAVFDSKEFVDKHQLKSIMRIFATRAASELERQHVEEQLKKARDRAVSASRSKSEFLANMSHELRTPMHAILSFASMGKDESPDGDRDELKHYFTRIRESGERLMNLLNDLLDLSKFNAGKMVFEFALANLADQVKSTISEYEAMAGAKRIALTVEAPEFDTGILFDKDKMAQVVRNLISNAIKFSHEGSAVKVDFVKAKLASHAGEVDAIAFRVIDQGVGVPVDEHLSIFEQFQQSSRTNRHAGGTGLGLAICKEIVVAHQGEINVVDNPEGGAIFIVTLPLHIA